MTVAEFIEWLKTQDQGAIVKVIFSDDSSAGWEEEFTPDRAEYRDLRGNPHVDPMSPRANKRYLILGERS